MVYGKALILIWAFLLPSCVTITETKDVGKIVAEFHEAFDPIFDDLDVDLKIELSPSSRVNITVEKKNGAVWVITIYAGFIKHPQINTNGLRIALCHEIGHLLGPKVENAMYSDEYDSDEYAILACFNVLKMDTDQLLDGIDSIYRWYKLYPAEEKYPYADERRDFMIEAFRDLIHQSE